MPSNSTMVRRSPARPAPNFSSLKKHRQAGSRAARYGRPSHFGAANRPWTGRCDTAPERESRPTSLLRSLCIERSDRPENRHRCEHLHRQPGSTVGARGTGFGKKSRRLIPNSHTASGRESIKPERADTASIMVKVVGADSGRSAEGTGEVASSAALDAGFAVYANDQPRTMPLPA